jgi:hypothetical protein
MHKYNKIGLSLICLGFLMFLLGVDQFASHGPINPILRNFGMISFIAWLPTILIGLFFILRPKNKK